MQPFTLESRPVVRVWGGDRLQRMGLCPPGKEPIGESWEVFGELLVTDGPHRGCRLDALCADLGVGLLGSWCQALDEGFPLLTKWLDCCDWLSLQVHPDDTVARQIHGNPQERGKSEAWLFFEVEPEAEVIHGWSEGRPGPERLAQLQGADWLPAVRRFKPQVGSWVNTPPGTIHALGPGLLVFEVQQSSDLTYRIYDWERMGLDGKPRPLHLKEACQAISQSAAEPVVQPPDDLLGKLEILNPHFCVETIAGAAEWSPQGRSVELLTALQAEVRIRCGGQEWLLPPGTTLVVPADAADLQCLSEEGHSWLRVRLAPGRN